MSFEFVSYLSAMAFVDSTYVRFGLQSNDNLETLVFNEVCKGGRKSHDPVSSWLAA